MPSLLFPLQPVEVFDQGAGCLFVHRVSPPNCWCRAVSANSRSSHTFALDFNGARVVRSRHPSFTQHHDVLMGHPTSVISRGSNESGKQRCPATDSFFPLTQTT